MLISNSKKNRINRQITARKVRLIGQEGEQLGIMNRDEALQAAYDSELDLVEIAPNAEPPVCRIMDYGKFQFEQSKKQAASKKAQKQIKVKEVKFRPTTEEGDYQVKLRNLKRFLAAGDKTKVTVRFRGREIAHQSLGLNLLERIKQDLAEESIVEQEAQREGRQLIMVLAPKKTS